ncbi:MAG: EsaB/YukD family protein [Planctomycetota bacterium]|jgi:uncharacterized ubiquitin-like protein YukD
MKITVKWLNGNTGTTYDDQFPPKAPLHAVKIILLAASGWGSPADAGNYVVKKTMDGDPLDESKTLEELGISDGDALFLVLA